MISSKITVPVFVAIACILALLVGTNLAVDSGSTMTLTVALGGGFLLLLFARSYWWLALFAGAACGGFAYFGFKLYPHEALLAVALAGLIPSIAISPRSNLLENRPPLPRYILAFFLYLIVHIFFSIWWNSPRGMIEYGNVARAYMFGLWPVLFVFLFRLYGRSDLFRSALYLLQGIYFLRASVTLAVLYSPKALILPGINFMLPGTAMGSGLDDLRWSGYGICLISAALLLGMPSVSGRWIQCALITYSAVLLLMGGGRVMIVSAILVILAALCASRQWKFVASAATGVCLFISFLNIFPDTLSTLDARWQRALSIFVFNYRSSDQYAMVQGSDIWHDRLEQIGFERWSQSPKTILLGTGIAPWKANVMKESNWASKFEALLQGAADTGNYESALWTVLAVTGLVGFGLCIATLFYFTRYNIKVLFGVPRPTGFRLTAAFLGSFVPVHWLLFCPRLGGYPGLELMIAAVAFYYLRDNAEKPDESGPDDEGSIYSESSFSR